MEKAVVIGRHHYGYLSGGSPNRDITRRIPNAMLNRLEYMVLSDSTRMIKDTFVSLAADWEKA